MSLKEKIEALNKEAAELSALLEKYPSLQENNDRWNNPWLYASEINNSPLLKLDIRGCRGTYYEYWHIYKAYIEENNHYIY